MSAPLVLLVDPHDDSRTIYTIILRHAGFSVHATGCADEALRAAVLHPPDVVVLGTVPQRGPALRALRGFRGDPATAHVPVVCLSTVPAEDEREEMLAEGIAAYIAKPCAPLDLLTEVRRLLAR